MIQESKVDKAYRILELNRGVNEAEAFMELVKDRSFSASKLADAIGRELHRPTFITESSIRRWRKSHGIK